MIETLAIALLSLAVGILIGRTLGRWIINP